MIRVAKPRPRHCMQNVKSHARRYRPATTGYKSVTASAPQIARTLLRSLSHCAYHALRRVERYAKNSFVSHHRIGVDGDGGVRPEWNDHHRPCDERCGRAPRERERIHRRDESRRYDRRRRELHLRRAGQPRYWGNGDADGARHRIHRPLGADRIDAGRQHQPELYAAGEPVPPRRSRRDWRGYVHHA